VTLRNKHIKSLALKAKSSPKIFLMLAIAICLFLPQSTYAQVLNNEGAVINVSNAVIDGGDVENTTGEIINEGTINLLGRYWNNANTRGSGYYNVGGDWVNLDFFAPDNSTVQLYGSAVQNVINPPGDDFYNLRINNSGDYNNGAGSKILLNHNIEVLNTLSLDQGNIEYTDRVSDRLYLMNPIANSLIYTSGRIIGKFERGVGSTENYLFPLGSVDYYNPLNLKPNTLDNPGSVLSDFLRPNDLGNAGLPLVDSFAIDTSEIYETFPEGYWSMEANGGFITSDYNVDMDGAGFTDVQPITRVLKREKPAGNWEVDGTHGDVTNSTVAKRDNLDDGIPNNGNHYAFGRARPHIKIQPVNDTVCELSPDGDFRVKASGRRWFNNRLKYQWQIFEGGGWVELNAGHADFDNYTGTDEKELRIVTAYLTMDQNQYRVVITDKHNNDKISDVVILTVEPLPTAIATPQEEVICNDEFTSISVTTDLLLPGTTYILEVLSNGIGVTGASDDAFGDDFTLQQQLNNPGSILDSVIYRIVPYGPSTLYCEGWADTVIIWVNPTPDIDVLLPDSVICNDGSTDFAMTTLNTRIRGDWYYDLTVTPDAGISGARSTDRLDEVSFTETLTNSTSIVQKVEYYFHPVIEPDDAGIHCENGGPNDTLIIVWVNPTPDIDISVPDTVVCNDAITTVTISTLNDSLRGSWFYDISVVNKETGIESPDLSLDSRRIFQGLLDLNLTNNTPDVKTVTYNFHPVIEPDDDGDDCENGVPNDTTITFFVNPTPDLIITELRRSTTEEFIYCNGDSIDFFLENSQTITGNIMYDLRVSLDTAVIYGNKTIEFGRDPNEDFTETLIHYQDNIKDLRYTFTPYIESLTGAATCYGVDYDYDNVDSIDIQMVPVLKSDITPTTYFGDYDIRCFGEIADIDLTPVGGDYRYNYAIEWRADDEDGDNLQQTAYVKGDVLEDLVKGFYYYSITDTLGCFHDTIKEMVEPDLLQVEEFSIVAPECVGAGYKGDIYLDVVTGGADTYDYTYKWISASSLLEKGTDSFLLDQRPADYYVIITDRNSCVYTNEPDELLYHLVAAQPFSAQVIDSSFYGRYDISCYGAADAMVKVTGNGLNEPFDYTWYDEDLNYLNSLDTISNRSPGTYYYQVTDSKGCQTGDNLADSVIRVEITEPDPITFVRPTTDLYGGAWDIKCYGDTLGRINLNYFGGHTEYLDNTFDWTSNDGFGLEPDSSSQDSLIAGTYSLQIEDFYGCIGDTAIVLEEPKPITFTGSLRVNDFGTKNISCFGDKDGEIHLLNLNGGGPKDNQGDGPEDYTYVWKSLSGVVLNDSTVQNLIGIPEGIYSVRVTDVLGCWVEKDTILEEPDSLFAIPGNFINHEVEISCFNGSDGWVSLTPLGGTRPYSYDWSEIGGATDTIISELAAGDYSVTLSDPNGCTNTYEWTLDQPDTIRINSDATDLIECYGDTSTIHISPTGGVGGYTYLWEGIADDSALNGVEDGMYYVLIEDLNGCQVDDSLYLGQRSRIMPEIVVRSDYHGEHISCYGLADASIELIISGGNSLAYTREWSTGSDDDGKSILTGLPAAIYTISGIDASGCAYDTTFEVIQPLLLQLNYTSSDPLCKGAADGNIRLSPQGGTPIDGSPVYNYYFEGIDSLLSAEFLNLEEGVYKAAVTDWNLCTDTMEIELIAPDAIYLEYDSVSAECPDESDGSLVITYIDGGTEPYTINGGMNREFEGLGSGEFIINLVDAQNCTYVDTVTIGSIYQSCLDIPNAFTPNGDGANDVWRLDDDEDGSDMYLYPDAELTIINRWGEIIYFSSNVVNEPWDGTYKGRDLPIDSYYYMLDLKNGDSVITGNVTIIR
jgi:gliding motility-associated-like protein